MKALIIFAFRNYQDFEFSKTKEVLENAGIELDFASTQKGLAKGAFGAIFNVSKILEEVVDKVSQYDAIIFIGGAGTLSLRAKRESVTIAQDAFKKNKIVGAICWAPTILAKSGILKNKKATVWFGPDEEYNKTTKEVLEQYGCDYSKEFVVVDKNIVTAEGPMHTEKFAEQLVKLLKKNR